MQQQQGSKKYGLMAKLNYKFSLNTNEDINDYILVRDSDLLPSNVIQVYTEYYNNDSITYSEDITIVGLCYTIPTEVEYNAYVTKNVYLNESGEEITDNTSYLYTGISYTIISENVYDNIKYDFYHNTILIITE